MEWRVFVTGLQKDFSPPNISTKFTLIRLWILVNVELYIEYLDIRLRAIIRKLLYLVSFNPATSADG